MIDNPLQLIDRYLDGEATPDEIAALERAMETDESLIDLVASRAALFADLRHVSSRSANPAASIGPDAQRYVWERGVKTSPFGRVAPLTLAIAAALLLSAAAVAIYVLVVDGAPSTDPSDLTPIATLIDSTGTVLANGDIAGPGSEIASGTYSIESGSAQFLLESRVTADLRGETEITVHDAMSATLNRGSAQFHCPPGSEGFTVHLPDGSRVVDLGTRFTVRVDDNGVAEVRVLEGLVEVNPVRGDSAQRLAAGQVVDIVDGMIGPIAFRPIAFQIDFNGAAAAQDNRGDATGVIGPARLGPSWNTLIHNQTVDGLTDDFGDVWAGVSATTHAKSVGVGSGFALEADASTRALTGDFLLGFIGDIPSVGVSVHGLPEGTYDLYVIAGNVDTDPTSQLDTYRIELAVDDQPSVAADLGPIGNAPDAIGRWTENAHYIKRRIDVVDGQTLTVTSRGTRRGYHLLNGIQIVSVAPNPDPKINETTANPGRISTSLYQESQR